MGRRNKEKARERLECPSCSRLFVARRFFEAHIAREHKPTKEIKKGIKKGKRKIPAAMRGGEVHMPSPKRLYETTESGVFITMALERSCFPESQNGCFLCNL